jgi:hypothetical protein
MATRFKGDSKGMVLFGFIFWLMGILLPPVWGLEVSPADKKAYYDALAATETATQNKISTRNII